MGKSFLILIVLSGLGFGGWMYMETYGFDYKNASRDAQRAYLERQTGYQKGTFKPNYLSRFTRASVSGRSLVFTYNTGMGSLTCGHKVDCMQLFCWRYGQTSLSKNEIPVRLIFTDDSGRQIDRKAVSPAECRRYTS